MFKAKTWQAQATVEERQKRINRRLDALASVLEDADEMELALLDVITETAMTEVFNKIIRAK